LKCWKTPSWKYNLKIFFICKKCLILQNGLHVHEILIFENFQLSRALKNTYVSLNYECYNHNTSNFNYEVGLNTILTQLVSNILSTHFYDTKVVQTLYSTSYKLNVGSYGFILKFQNILNLLSCVHIKNYFVF